MYVTDVQLGLHVGLLTAGTGAVSDSTLCLRIPSLLYILLSVIFVTGSHV